MLLDESKRHLLVAEGDLTVVKSFVIRADDPLEVFVSSGVLTPTRQKKSPRGSDKVAKGVVDTGEKNEAEVPLSNTSQNNLQVWCILYSVIRSKSISNVCIPLDAALFPY